MRPPRYYYISRNYKFTTNAASKPKMDVEHIFESCGIKNLGFKQSNLKSSALGAIINFFGISWGLLRLPFGSVLFMQYPLSKYFHYKIRIARLKGCKVILLVHDVKTLMGKNQNPAREMKRFKLAHLLVLHNCHMIKWFEENGYAGPSIPLFLFDYLITSGQELPPLPTSFENKLVFAGSLDLQKSAFLYKIDEFIDLGFQLNICGSGYQKKLVSDQSVLNFMGSFPPDEVLYKLKGNFGLVWNGSEIDHCGGDFGNYIKYNNPHKVSLYLLAGLPIIIWDQAALAEFVQEQGIGILIGSLEDIGPKLAAIDKSTYFNMLENVSRVREGLSRGAYLTEAIERAKSALL